MVVSEWGEEYIKRGEVRTWSEVAMAGLICGVFSPSVNVYGTPVSAKSG